MKNPRDEKGKIPLSVGEVILILIVIAALVVVGYTVIELITGTVN